MRLSSLVASSWALDGDDEDECSLPTDAETDPDLPELAADWTDTDPGEVDRATDSEAADLSTEDLGAAGLEAVFWAFEDWVVAGLEAVGPEAACLAGVLSEVFLASDGRLDVCPVCAAVFSGGLTDPAGPDRKSVV